MGKKQTQRGARFLVSESKIKEFAALNITPDSVERSPQYFKGIVDYIVANSTITKLSKGDSDKSVYGLIYKLTLNDDIPSPLVNLKVDETSVFSGKGPLDSKHYKPVRSFLLKLSFLSILNETSISNKGNKRTCLMTDFVKETKIQNEAYDLTYQLGESVVPACLAPAYYDLFMEKDRPNATFGNLLDPKVDDDGYLEYLTYMATSKHVLQFGLILMEYAEGFKTLEDTLRDKKLSKEDRIRAIMLAKMSHLILAQKGLVQGDCHDQNVMVNLDYKGFLSGILGKAVVIDFGRAQKIPGILPTNIVEIMHLINIASNPGEENLPQYEWIKIAEALELDYLGKILDYREERFDMLKTHISSFFSKGKNALVSQFIEKFNIGSLNRLRWLNLVPVKSLEEKPKNKGVVPNKTRKVLAPLNQAQLPVAKATHKPVSTPPFKR
jgi:hypothetical protein